MEGAPPTPPVGYSEGIAFDPARSNWNGDGPRPLRWAVWYPAADGVAAEPLSRYPWFRGAPVLRDSGMRPSTAPYDVVLLSHGTGGVGAGLGWLAHRLALNGFIALAVDHHGNTGSEPYRAEGFLCLWERAADLSAIFDDAGWRTLLSGPHSDRAYVAGSSAGAYAAMLLIGARVAYSQFEDANPERGPQRGPREFPDLADHIPRLLMESPVFRDSWDRRTAPFRDERFRAALGIAPGRSVRGFSEASLAAITRPVRIIVGDADEAAPVEACSRWLCERVEKAELEILGGGVGHYAFLPEPTARGLRAAPELFTDAPGVDRAAIHARAAARAAHLFNSVRD